MAVSPFGFYRGSVPIPDLRFIQFSCGFDVSVTVLFQHDNNDRCAGALVTGGLGCMPQKCDEALLEPIGTRNAAHFTIYETPFGPTDATAGSEDELHAVVLGDSSHCDLPLSIRESHFYQNIARRSARGEAPRRTLLELEAFLNDSRGVWENSWVRFPESCLSPHALAVFQSDLQVVRNGNLAQRSDAARFRFHEAGEVWVRIPISYVLKLALADLTATQPHLPEALRRRASRLMGHFLSDNTSPETTSFHVAQAGNGKPLGAQVARESARRFLFTTLLVAWANRRFGLLDRGQRTLVYHAPVPSVHQEDLASCVSDSFYRELFMSPCLSGWSDGEEKHQYMHLCHQVLSRSQLNALAKLREAGIIANELIVLPSLSNISLANNGIHVSIGSRMLSERLRCRSGFDAEDEKRLGDLAIKIYEHFLALFVGTYTAAPQRIGFSDFHPERRLSFLPHELDFTHLRLFWREWKEKADLRIFGHPLTPYGPTWLDRLVSKLFVLRGDLVPDARLLTYPVAWLATLQASALDGTRDNIRRLTAELDSMGIVDQRLSFYMPLRLREFARSGYTGFEARYYSLFPSYDRDMAPAVSLQQFLLAFSFKLAREGRFTHAQIPDDPTSESERREAFFFASAGLPAFYVHHDSRNQLLRDVLLECRKIRASHRHPGYQRVPVNEFRKALIVYLERHGCELMEAMNLQPVLADLHARCVDTGQQATKRLLCGILGDSSADPMRTAAREFNHMAEDYYRETLRRFHLTEAMAHLREDAAALERSPGNELRKHIRYGVRVQNLPRFLQSTEEKLLADDLVLPEIAALLNLLLVLMEHDSSQDTAAAE